MSEPAIRRLSEVEARSLTDEVKADATALWAKLLDLYHGDAHGRLGYSSWGAYYEAEFGAQPKTGYRLLEAARVVGTLSDTHVTPPSQNTARELTALLDQPQQLRDTWAETVERHGDQPTAAQVREVVRGPDVDRPRDPGPRVQCPTCGHMVKPDDIRAWRD